MPRGQGRRGFGDLLVRCRVKMPGRISASDKSLLREVGFRGIEQESAEERGDKTAREEGEL
jgi:DnaJ-class molecular chaperone